MAPIEGDGVEYGVLGTGVPRTWTYEDGDEVFVNSIGVLGVVGDSNDDVQDYLDSTVNDLNGPITAAVVGVVPLRTGAGEAPEAPSTGILDARIFGFLAGTDPRNQNRAGVYGESEQWGVIGVSTGAGGAAVEGRGFGEALAGNFVGNVEITGTLTVQGESVLDAINELKDLKNRLDALDKLGMTDHGVAVLKPLDRPNITLQLKNFPGGPFLQVDGDGFSNHNQPQAIRIIMDGVENVAPGPVPLPWTWNNHIYPGHTFAISAQDSSKRRQRLDGEFVEQHPNIQ